MTAFQCLLNCLQCEHLELSARHTKGPGMILFLHCVVSDGYSVYKATILFLLGSI